MNVTTANLTPKDPMAGLMLAFAVAIALAYIVQGFASLGR